MEFRNVFIANPAKITIEKKQLVIEQDKKHYIPGEEISAVMIESHQATITSYALQFLIANGVHVFFCDEKHMPSAVTIPMNCHSRHFRMLKKQIKISRPLQKQLWASIVKQKVMNQGLCLEYLGIPNAIRVKDMSYLVSSGDAQNIEAQAAQLYFPMLAGKGFTRSQETVFNGALNYGYAVLRGIIARSLVMYGMEPSFGIHHHSELNQFNLADDLIEAYRPIVDLLVASWDLDGEEELTPKLKQQLFHITNYVILLAEKRYRVMSAVGKTIVSFSQSLKEGENILELPTLVPLEVFEYA